MPTLLSASTVGQRVADVVCELVPRRRRVCSPLPSLTRALQLELGHPAVGHNMRRQFNHRHAVRRNAAHWQFLPAWKRQGAWLSLGAQSQTRGCPAVWVRLQLSVEASTVALLSAVFASILQQLVYCLLMFVSLPTGGSNPGNWVFILVACTGMRCFHVHALHRYGHTGVGITMFAKYIPSMLL